MSWRSGGVRTWVVQRVSAVYMVFFIIGLFVALMFNGSIDYATWRGWFQNPLMNVAGLMFWLALLIHAWIGVRDVIIDYIAGAGLRFLALMLAAFYLIAMGVWVVKILLVIV